MGITHVAKRRTPMAPVALAKVEEDEDTKLMREGQEIEALERTLKVAKEAEAMVQSRARAEAMKSIRTQVELQVGFSAGIYACIAAGLDGGFWAHPTLAIVLLALNLTAAACANSVRRYG